MNHHSASANSHPAFRRINEFLERLSRAVSAWTGTSWAFAIAVLVIAIWIVTGPIFQFSDTWQLVINTGTTIVTFLMVFLIQRSQNKDALAIQVKLDELLASQQGADNRLINVEDWDEEDIAALHQRFTKLSDRLQDTAEQCASHSIVEMKEAVNEAKEKLGRLQENRDRQRDTGEIPAQQR